MSGVASIMSGWNATKILQTIRNHRQNFGVFLRAQGAGWQPRACRMLKLLPAPLFIVLVAVVNPLGVKSSSSQTSIDTYRQIAAGAYPDTGQRKIAVVQIDDRSLNAAKEPHPPSFDFYVRLIEEIKAAGAKSILLDLMIISKVRHGDPEGLNRLATVMENFPVFLTAADDRGNEAGCRPDGVQNIPELQKAATREPHALIRDQATHVDLFLDNYCGFSRMSASLAAYQHYCQQDDACRKSANNPLVNQDAFRNKALTIEWGRAWPAGAEAIHAGYRNLAESCPKRSSLAALGNAFFTFFTFRGEGPSKESPGCSYHPLIRAEWLVAPDPRQEVDQSALRAFLAGRIVVVGNKLAGIPDVGPSPVFGDIPGMFLHAMAIDNLIVRGADFMTEWPKGSIGGLDTSGLAEFAAMGLFASVGHALSRRIVLRRTRDALLWTLVLVLAGWACGLLISAGLVWMCRLEPVNWIGVVLAGAVIASPARSAVARAWHAALTTEPQTISKNGDKP
ncbi:CHASE2 domain-containing protein [Azospirillum argentinense]